MQATYVYPNTCEIPQRGGLLSRWKLLANSEFSVIEVPADFIKNNSEEVKTGLSVTDFLSEKAIETLYNKGDNIPSELQYILHTEPSLPRTDHYQIVTQPLLKWYDKQWVEKLCEMTLNISKFLSKPPFAIEIHPGDNRNKYSDICEAANFLIERYFAELKVRPLILLENRTGQFISKGSDISCFWKLLKQNYTFLEDKVGIVLDIQQLFTVTRKQFEEQFEKIPFDAIKGVHIHSKHKAPKSSDEIPWVAVFEKLSKIAKNLIVNPEVSHRSDIQRTLDFWKNGIEGSH